MNWLKVGSSPNQSNLTIRWIHAAKPEILGAVQLGGSLVLEVVPAFTSGFGQNSASGQNRIVSVLVCYAGLHIRIQMLSS